MDETRRLQSKYNTLHKSVITVGGDNNHFYPCTWTESNSTVYMSIHSPSMNGGYAYNQNCLTFLLSSYGWSDMPVRLVVLESSRYDRAEVTIHSIHRGTQNGSCCVYLRGGMSYTVWSNAIITPHTEPYTFGSEVYNIMNNDYTVSNTNVTKIYNSSDGINIVMESNPPNKIVKYNTSFSDTSGGQYLAIDSQNSWAYLSLRNSSTQWDIATTPVNNNQLEFRPLGADLNRMILTKAGNLSVNGTVTASGGFFESSDQSVKENIKPIEMGGGIINLYEFDRTDTKEHGYGVIAQEIEKLYPDIVNTDEEGFKTVNYTKALVIKCAEQDKRIKELEDKVNRLIENNS